MSLALVRRKWGLPEARPEAIFMWKDVEILYASLRVAQGVLHVTFAKTDNTRHPTGAQHSGRCTLIVPSRSLYDLVASDGGMPRRHKRGKKKARDSALPIMKELLRVQ